MSESPSNGKSQPRLRSIYHSYHSASMYMNFRQTRTRVLYAAIELALILVIHALCLCHLCNLKPHKCHSWPYFATVTFDQVCISVFHCIGNVKLWCNCMYTWFECLIVCLYPHGCIPSTHALSSPAQNIYPLFRYTIFLGCTTICIGLCLLMQSSSHSV